MTWLALKAFFGTPLGRNLGVALAVLALLASLYGLARHQGADSIRKADTKARAAATADLARHEATASQISTAARNTLSQRQAQIIVRTHTIVQRIKEYVPASADARCVVSVGLVRLHDAAARGLPEPSGGPDETASGYGLSDLSRTVASNYGVAYGWREEALAWRDWYAKQKAAWEKK